MAPPLLLFGTAHPQRRIQVRSLKLCIESDCAHPKVRELKETPALIAEAFMFIEGDQDIQEFQLLDSDLACFLK